MLHRLLLTSLLAAPLAASAQQKLDHFVHANAAHTLYHELAHALIDQFNIPILGQEEDAADNFATLELARRFGPEAKPMLSDVATAWLMLHDDLAPDDFDYHDNHDLYAQRAYRTICMFYGLDPAENTDIANWADIPQDLHGICEETALMTRDNWEGALANTLRQDDDPVPEVTLTYAPPERNNVLKVRLEASGLLEDFVADITDSFAWPAPIKVVALTCNEPNAFWDPETRSIEFCYEILGEWMDQSRRDTRPLTDMFRTPSGRDTPALRDAPEKNVRD